MVPPFFTAGSHRRPHKPPAVSRKILLPLRNNACLRVTSYSSSLLPDRLSVCGSKMYSQFSPSCASHLPTALCMGVRTATSSLPCLFRYSVYQTTLFPNVCQADFRLPLPKIFSSKSTFNSPPSKIQYIQKYIHSMISTMVVKLPYILENPWNTST